MTYWVEYKDTWRENLMTDSVIKARRAVYLPLSTKRYGTKAWIFSGKNTEFPIGEMEMDKHGNVFWRSEKNGTRGKRHVVMPSGELYN